MGSLSPRRRGKCQRRVDTLPDPWSCFYCGKPLDIATRTIDHVIPRSRGGSNRKENLVPACRPCNEAKGALTIKEYREQVRPGRPFHGEREVW